MKWARENGAPWDEWTCAFAARGGHLDVLKWARENGAPWNDKIKKEQTRKDILSNKIRFSILSSVIKS